MITENRCQKSLMGRSDMNMYKYTTQISPLVSLSLIADEISQLIKHTQRIRKQIVHVNKSFDREERLFLFGLSTTKKNSPSSVCQQIRKINNIIHDDAFLPLDLTPDKFDYLLQALELMDDLFAILNAYKRISSITDTKDDEQLVNILTQTFNDLTNIKNKLF